MTFPYTLCGTTVSGHGVEQLSHFIEVIAKPPVHDVARPLRPCRKGEGALATAGFTITSIKCDSSGGEFGGLRVKFIFNVL